MLPSGAADLTLRYAVAVLAVAAAVAAGFVVDSFWQAVPFVSLFICAILVAGWIGGAGPGLLATTLSIIAFDYYFIPPRYSLAVGLQDIPRLALFAAAALFVVWVSAAQRRTTEYLRRTRDDLSAMARQLDKRNEELKAENAERLHAEQTARRAEQELQEAIDTIPAIVARYRADGSPEFVNKTWRTYTGLTLDSLRGKRWAAAVHPDELPRLEAAWRAHLASGEPFEIEQRLRRADGIYRWQLVRRVPLRNEKGEVIRWYGVGYDVEEHKQAQRALERSQAYLAEAQRLSNTGSFGWNIGTGEVSWSKETYRILEYDEAVEPTIILILDRVHPQDRLSVQEQFDDAARGGREFDFQHRLLMPDGTVKYVQIRARRQVYGPGEEEIVGALMDITGLRTAYVELRESEQRFRDYAETASDWFWATDCEHRFTFISKQSGEFGYDSIGPIGQRRWDFAADLRREPEKWSAHMAIVDRHEPFRDFVYAIRRIDGSLGFVSASGKPTFDGEGRFSGYRGVARDLTEERRAKQALERSEAYLAEAQRLTHTGSWARDSKTEKMVYCSEEMLRIFGFDPQQPFPRSEEFWERIVPHDYERVDQAVKNSFRQRTDFVDEFMIRLPNGVGKYVQVIGHPVLNEGDEVVEYVGTVVDVSERKRAEEERERLRHMEADLEHLNRVSIMGELAASLAHEIKQPLAAAAINASACARWLQRDVPNLLEASEAASQTIEGITRASDIIDRVRSLYGRGNPERQSIDLNELIREMVSLLADTAGRNSVSIRTDLAQELPAIKVDRVQLQQVLMNLMLNGIEAMQDHGGELTIASKCDSGHVTVSVADTGCGIRLDGLERMFEAFFTTKPHGTGMGLSISRRIAESHGGRLWASRNAGPGATFQFTLPVEVTSSAA